LSTLKAGQGAVKSHKVFILIANKQKQTCQTITHLQFERLAYAVNLRLYGRDPGQVTTLKAVAVQGINQAQSVLFEVDEGLGDTNFNGEVGNFNIHKELLRIKSNAGGEILDIIPLDQVFKDGA